MSIGDLMILLKDVMPEWKTLAIYLKVKTGATIPKDLQCRECMAEMITHWMKVKGDKATIGAILKAVRDLDNNRLAGEIEEKFIGINIQLLEHIISSFLCRYYMKSS